MLATRVRVVVVMTSPMTNRGRAPRRYVLIIRQPPPRAKRIPTFGTTGLPSSARGRGTQPTKPSGSQPGAGVSPKSELIPLARVRHMATDVTLYIGAPNYAKFRFTDSHGWEGVRAQIINAMDNGRGTIEIDHKGDKVVYVYSPFLMISWTESGA